MLKLLDIIRRESRVRRTYPVGTRIKLLKSRHMDYFTCVYGTVQAVDTNGMLRMLWDDGSQIAIDPDHDYIEIIPTNT